MTTLAGLWKSAHPDTCPSLALALTPSESFPSVIGAAVAPTLTLVVGTYAPDAAKVTFRITVLAAGTNVICHASLSGFVLSGSWSDPTSGSSGLLQLTLDPQSASSLDGMWVGSAVPDPELAPFCIPVNPVRWVLARVPDTEDRIIGAGFFDDAADVPGQPVLAFALTGTGRVDGPIRITKTYEQAEGMAAFKVHYEGSHRNADDASPTLEGTWANPLGGSHGTFSATRISDATHFSGTTTLCSACSSVCPPDSIVFECTTCPASAAHVLCPDCVPPAPAPDHPLVRTTLYTPHIVTAITCADLTRSALSCYADRPFIGTRTSGWLSYADVASSAGALASLLAPLGPRGRVVLLGDMSPAYVTAMVSLLLSGVVIVPLDGALSAETLRAVIEKVGPAAVVSSKAYADKIAAGRGVRVHVYDREAEEEEGGEGEAAVAVAPVLPSPASSRSLSDVAALLFTSGSTGIPKGAIYTESMLLPSSSFDSSSSSNTNTTNVGTVVRLDFQAFHPSFVVSLLGIMAIGGSRFIATNPATLLEDMAVARPTRISAPPLFWTLLRKAYDARLAATGSHSDAASHVRNSLGNRVGTLISGGAALAPATRDFFLTRIGVEIDDLLGSREAGPIARNGVVYPSVSPVLLPLLDDEDQHQPLTPLPITPGTVGVLAVSSPRLIPAYFDDPGKTEVAFCTLTDSVDGTPRRYFITGDMARVVAAPGPLSGLHIELVGRAGHGCKLANSKWLAPSVLEAVLESHPWIDHALVAGSRDAYAPVAVVVLSGLAPDDVDPLEVRAELCFWCTHHHAEFVVAAVHVANDGAWTHANGALTATHKKQRSELHRRYAGVLAELMLHSSSTLSVDVEPVDHDDDMMTVQLSAPLANALSSALAVPSPLPRSLLSRSLVELGGDSLTLIRLASHLRSVGVPVTVPALQAYPVSHIDAIVRRASSSVAAAVAMPPLRPRAVDWDSALALGPLPTPFAGATPDRGVVLLTGGTGFLGKQLVTALLADERVSHVTMLVRSLPQHENPRLSYIVGDLQKQPRLGLSDEVWDELVNSNLGTILHCGAKVNMVLGFGALQAANCDSTRTLLHLAALTGARMLYVSSVAVLPAAEFALEGWLAPPDHKHMAAISGYAASKTVSEGLAAAAAAAGVNVCVVRASMLGPGADGVRNPRDVLTRLLDLCVQLGTGPRGGMSLDWYPVDTAAADIVTLALASSLPPPPVFHLAGTGPKLYEQLDADGVVERMEAEDWRELAGPALADDPLRDIVLNMAFSGRRGVVPMRRTREALAQLRE